MLALIGIVRRRDEELKISQAAVVANVMIAQAAPPRFMTQHLLIHVEVFRFIIDARAFAVNDVAEEHAEVARVVFGF